MKSRCSPIRSPVPFAVAKLIAIVGNSGAGKTTLTRQLCKHGSFVTGLEQIAERPFQALFAQELYRYALPNQIDYLLLRAQQEWVIRQGAVTGIQDGGLEMDFHVFARLFFEKGYLSHTEYQLCARLYGFFRQLLPPPDLIIHLVAPLEVITQRYRRRNRSLEIARLDDLARMETLLRDWLRTVTTTPVLVVNAEADDPTYTQQVERILAEIPSLFSQ